MKLVTVSLSELLEMLKVPVPVLYVYSSAAELVPVAVAVSESLKVPVFCVDSSELGLGLL